MDHGQTALTIGASCFIARRRASVVPERGMPENYVQKELAAPLEIVRNLIRRGASVTGSDADGVLRSFGRNARAGQAEQFVMSGGIEYANHRLHLGRTTQRKGDQMEMTDCGLGGVTPVWRRV